jgi:hypothetical protein
VQQRGRPHDKGYNPYTVGSFWQGFPVIQTTLISCHIQSFQHLNCRTFSCMMHLYNTVWGDQYITTSCMTLPSDLLILCPLMISFK